MIAGVIPAPVKVTGKKGFHPLITGAVIAGEQAVIDFIAKQPVSIPSLPGL